MEGQIMTRHIDGSGSRTCSFRLTSLATRIAIALVAIIVAPAAHAAEFGHGSFGGTDYTFVNVTESSTEPGAIYRAPTVSGNSLDFNPLGYTATASNGAVDGTSGNLTLGITTKKKNGPGI